MTTHTFVFSTISGGYFVSQTAILATILPAIDNKVDAFFGNSGGSEIWLSSSTKELAPVVSVDGKLVNEGRPGARWSAAQKLFQQHRFSSP